MPLAPAAPAVTVSELETAERFLKDFKADSDLSALVNRFARFKNATLSTVCRQENLPLGCSGKVSGRTIKKDYVHAIRLLVRSVFLIRSLASLTSFESSRGNGMKTRRISRKLRYVTYDLGLYTDDKLEHCSPH